MSLSAPSAALRKISQRLLDPSRSVTSLVRETTELRELLESVSSLMLPAGYDINAGKIVTANGLAVSAAQAAHCAREPARTAAFIKGLHEAVQTILRTKPQACILYAGCGPYALLALPLLACFTPQKIQFSLLEIHAQTLVHARELIADFGFAEHVGSSHCVDACAYQIPATALPDIILSETMNIALGKEPQVALMRNLHLQAPQALLVPQAVHVHLGRRCKSESSDLPPAHDDLGCVFTLDAAHIDNWQPNATAHLPANSIHLTTGDSEVLYLLTRIQTYDQWQLHDYESSLNLPQKLRIPPSHRDRLQLDFGYRLGSHPGLFLQ